MSLMILVAFLFISPGGRLKGERVWPNQRSSLHMGPMPEPIKRWFNRRRGTPLTATDGRKQMSVTSVKLFFSPRLQLANGLEKRLRQVKRTPSVEATVPSASLKLPT